MKSTFLTLIISLLTFSNGFGQENLPPPTQDAATPEFDYGSVKNGIYKNSFFDLEVTFDPEWAVQNQQQVDQLLELGEEMIVGDNADLKRVIKASKINVSNLLTVYKYELGSAVDFNPSFMLTVENTQLVPGIKNGKDYLFHAKKLLSKLEMKYVFDKDVYEKKIGKTTFHVLEAKIDFMDLKIKQDYIVTIKNGFSVIFIASYKTKAEKKEVYKVINNIKMN
ncbi:MAG: hypothetical protein PHQ74_09965 [Crocinitomicaceae bacterium]|nr:hypothetical protein [Crocinitomicaceae bacterium]